MSQAQVHESFAVFIDLFTNAAASAEEFVKTKGAVAKSLSVEEDQGGKVILTLGYSTTGTSLPVKISQVCLGSFERKVNGSFDPREIEGALTTAADAVKNVICHDFYVNGSGYLFASFLSA